MSSDNAVRDYADLNVQQPESETDPFTEDRYRQFFRWFPRQARTVLDVGCNTGRGGTVLKGLDPGLQIAGLDVVASRLERLPTAYARGILGPSTAIPCEEGAFDVVVAGEFIEHLYARDVQQSIAEMFRVLRLGGRLLMTTPNPWDVKRRWRGSSILGGAHVSQHFPEVLRLQLMMAGFSRVRVRGSGKVSRYLGQYAPLCLYGSYLIMADKF